LLQALILSKKKKDPFIHLHKTYPKTSIVRYYFLFFSIYMLIELNIITIHYINSVRIVNAHHIIYIYFYCFIFS